MANPDLKKESRLQVMYISQRSSSIDSIVFLALWLAELNITEYYLAHSISAYDCVQSGSLYYENSSVLLLGDTTHLNSTSQKVQTMAAHSEEFSTLDFLLGEAGDLPKPTAEQYAKKIFDISKRLSQSGVLILMTQHSWLGRTLKETYTLAKAMETLLPERYELLDGQSSRFISMSDPSSEYHRVYTTEEGLDYCVFLGTSRNREPLWFLVTEWNHRKTSERGVVSCVELDVSSMADMIASISNATPLAMTIVERLLWFAKDIAHEYKARLEEILRQQTLLHVDQSRLRVVSFGPDPF